MSVGGAQVIKTAEERPREANGLQEVSNVVGGELRTSRPVTCAARQVSDPQHHRERRQSEPGGVPRAFPGGQRGGENERHDDAGFLDENQGHADGRGHGELPAQKNDQREGREQESRGIQLGQHRLCEEERRSKQERGAQPGGVSGAAAKLGGKQEGRPRAQGRQQQHCDSRGFHVKSGQFPSHRQIRSHSGRMDIRDRRGGDPLAAEEKVAGGRYEVAGFIPIIGQMQKRKVRREDQQADDRQRQEAARLSPRVMSPHALR